MADARIAQPTCRFPAKSENLDTPTHRNATAALAHSITWRSSKQSYLTAVLLADRDLVDDCLRAYAYFRWADDRIDNDFPSDDDRIRFFRRQKTLMESCYRHDPPADLVPEERLLADLIAHDRGNADGLQSFIRNFMWVLEFDALRKGRLVHAQDLESYSAHLAQAVMDGFQYFIGNAHSYPRTPERTLSVLGAHITHMLRDMREDLASGYVNLPAEHFPPAGLDADELDGEFFRAWVRGEVVRARRLLRHGRRYIDSLDVLRCKLAGIWYCARFERVLYLIERDGYRLRKAYPERRNLTTWIQIASLSIPVGAKHCVYQLLKHGSRIAARPEQKPEVT